MSQLRTLFWLRYVIFRNSLRSGREVAMTAFNLVVLAGYFLFSLGLGAALFLSIVLLDIFREGMIKEGLTVLVSAMLFFQLATQATGTSAHFDPRRFILFPVSLTKLFFLNLVSAFGEVLMITFLPSVAGITMGLGVALGHPLAGLVAFLCAAIWVGALFAFVGLLAAWQLSGRKRRTEIIFGVLLGLLIIGGQLIPRLMETETGRAWWRLLPHYWEYLRDLLAWTPIGVWAYFFTHLQANDVTAAFARLLVVCVGWTGLTWMGGYAVFKRIATGARASSSSVAPSNTAARAARSSLLALRLPFFSGQTAAIFAKEVAYLIRNTATYLNAVSVLVLALLALRPAGRTERWPLSPGAFDWSDGLRVAVWVAYAFLINLHQFMNIFGLDAAGFRQYLLSPLEWRRLLVGKNLATWLFIAVQIGLIIVGAQIFYQDITAGKLYIAVCSTLVGMGLFSSVGNFLSVNFPFPLEFGMRTRRSGERFSATYLITMFGLAVSTAMLLGLPFGLSYLFQNTAIKYLSFPVPAIISIAGYIFWLGYQSQSLEARRFKITEALTRKTEKV